MKARLALLVPSAALLVMATSCRSLIETEVDYLGAGGAGASGPGSTGSDGSTSGSLAAGTAAGTGTGGSASVASSGSSGGGVSCPTSDGFDDPVDFTCWRQISEDVGLGTIATNGGVLEVTVDTALPLNGWWEDDHGPLLFQDVSGDFVVWVEVRVDVQPGQSFPSYRMGGLLLRRRPITVGEPEDWIKWEIGRRDDSFDPVEGTLVGVTSDSVSEHFGAGLEARLSMQLGACRVDDQLYLAQRRTEPEEPWLVGPFDGEDEVYPIDIASLGTSIQLGLAAAAYSGTSEEEVVVRFDHFTIAATTVNGMDGCLGALEEMSP